MNSDSVFPAGRTPRRYVGLVLRGFCMGCADVVPGVSGGTMAFILGIYEELVESIRQIGSRPVLSAAIRFRFTEVFEKVRWKFLASVLTGILLAVLSLAKVLEYLLESHAVLVWSFFFGLVLASVYTVSKRKTRWTPGTLTALIIGTAAAYLLVGMVPVQTPDAPWFLFLSGALAICAMILPGISGAFVLVLLGKYQFILSAVNQRDLLSLAYVAAGCAVGIVSFAQILGWFFRRYHDLTIAVLIGLMLGSLRKIWPWKETLATITDRHGKLIPVEQVNVLPDPVSWEFCAALVLALAGLLSVLFLDRLGGRPSVSPLPEKVPS